MEPVSQTRFAGHVALITGGAGGVGREVARRFAQAGAKVVIADLEETDVAGAAAEIGTSVSGINLDVAQEAQWELAIAGIESKHGPLSIVVNAAAYLSANSGFEDIPFALWQKHFEVNVNGTYLGCKHGLKSMRKRGGGSIVNIATGLVNRLRLSSSAYIASKTAVVAVTRLAALHSAPEQVRVNVLLPGALDTPMLYSNLAPGEDPAPTLALLRSRHPIGRIGTPGDMAESIMFLCDDTASSFITGAVIAIDGGQTLAT